MNILVVDAQGGGIGKQIVSAIKKKGLNAEIFAVGANSVATTAMIKAGADHGATGERPVEVCSKGADFIIGPVGIVVADSMYGEITPNMAMAIGQSTAKRILIPVSNCDNIVMGVNDYNLSNLIDEAVREIEKQIDSKC